MNIHYLNVVLLNDGCRICAQIEISGHILRRLMIKLSGLFLELGYRIFGAQWPMERLQIFTLMFYAEIAFLFDARFGF